MSTTANDATLSDAETAAIIDRAHFEADYSLLNTPHLKAQFIRRIGRLRLNELGEAYLATQAKKARR